MESQPSQNTPIDERPELKPDPFDDEEPKLRDRVKHKIRKLLDKISRK